MNLFNFKKIVEPKERLYGIALRFLGIDFLVSLNGWLNDFCLLDIRIIREGGCLLYFQTLGFVLWVGRNNILYEAKETLSL